MSDWLARALALERSSPLAPETPKTPKTPKNTPPNGSGAGHDRDFGDFGDRGSPAKVANPAKVQAPEPAVDGPPAWRDALLSLSPVRDQPWRVEDDPCPGFRSRTWPLVWAAALAFVDTHGAEAHAHDWTAVELFGVHPVVGVIRVDCSGALMLSCAGQVLAVEADRIRYENGHTYRRVPAGYVAPVPVWHFGRGVDQ